MMPAGLFRRDPSHFLGLAALGNRLGALLHTPRSFATDVQEGDAAGENDRAGQLAGPVLLVLEDQLGDHPHRVTDNPHELRHESWFARAPEVVQDERCRHGCADQGPGGHLLAPEGVLDDPRADEEELVDLGLDDAAQVPPGALCGLSRVLGLAARSPAPEVLQRVADVAAEQQDQPYSPAHVPQAQPSFGKELVAEPDRPVVPGEQRAGVGLVLEEQLPCHP
mmetsp:Transcript_84615/g.218053  ORF Transcript_84615/g.218053 Transcript_84615/m.218053 type:complete len:223 (+) Transcript_84615:257-925(+)